MIFGKLAKKRPRPLLASRAKLRRRLTLPLIAGVMMLLVGVLAKPASAAANIYAVAYMGTNGHLWYYDSTNGTHDTGLAMEPGTIPSLTYDGVSYTIAFDASNSHLTFYTVTGNSHRDTGIVMYTGANPSIAQNDLVAFEGSDGNLWYYKQGQGIDTHLGVYGGSYPAISGGLGGGLGIGEIAFAEANTLDMWLYNIQDGTHTDTRQHLYPFSSPSIGANASLQCCAEAFTAWATADMWYYDGSGHNSGLAEYTRNSPSISPLGGSGWIAFEGSNGNLWVRNALTNVNRDTGLPMSFRTRPSLGPSIDSTTGEITDYQVWFTSSTGKLSYYDIGTKTSHSVSGAAVNSNTYGVSYVSGVILACC